MTLRRAFRDRQEPESLHVFANVFWQLLILSSATTAVGIVAYNAWVYIDVNATLAGTSAIVVPAGEEKPPFDRSELKAVVTGAKAREERFRLYTEQTPAIDEPSVQSAAKPSENPKK